MPTVYNLERWTTALRDIYIKVRLGLSKTAATDVITGQWPAVEQHNFSNWMKYYESGEINKYKTAQYYINQNQDYFLPNPPTSKHQIPSPIRSLNEITQDANASADGILQGQEEIAKKKHEEEAAALRRETEKNLNDEFRRALMSRLNSIEKHLATSRGIDFFGMQYPTFLKAVHDLKHDLLTHKIHLSAQTCVDLIIKQAYKLQNNNCMVGADVMIKLANQTPGNTGDLAMGAIPAGGSVPDAGGNLTAPMPNLNPVPPAAAEEPKPTLTGMPGFIFNVNGGGLTDSEELDNDDSDNNEIVMDEDEVEVSAYLDHSDGELVVIGQEMPAQQEEVQESRPEARLQQKEQAENPEEKPQKDVPSSDFDALVNSAFDKLTMEDLLAKLQDINLIFKRKEINRQLALADLMLSRLGLTPYFSNFSEVQQKNLDCLNYSATRMDDIISTLQSGLGKGNIDLTEGQGEIDPQAQLLQRHLENEERKDKDRKEQRKEVNNQKLQLENTEKPEIEVESPGEELAEAAIPTAEEPVAPAPRPKAPVVPGA